MPVRREPGDKRSSVADLLTSVPVGARIESIRSSGKTTGRVSIRIAGQPLGTLTKDDADKLGLRAGLPWTPELALRLTRAFEVDEARIAAARLLDVRLRSKGELIDRLRRKRIKPAIADQLISELERAGKLDDRVFAAAYAKGVARKPSGARLIEAKLRGKRVDGTLARQAATAALQGRDLVEEATALARKKLRSMPAKLDAAARARRLLGLLARRGYEGDVCRRAARDALAAHKIAVEALDSDQ